jgi:regulator of replication initiation timing
MKDWNEEVKRLEALQIEEEEAKRLEVVSTETREIERLENERAVLWNTLNERKQEFEEIAAKNQPIINQINQGLNILNADLRSRMVSAKIQAGTVEHANMEMIQARTLRDSLKSTHYEGKFPTEIDKARYYAAEQSYMKAKDNLQSETEKRVELVKSFEELNHSDAITKPTEQVNKLRKEIYEANARVYEISARRDSLNIQLANVKSQMRQKLLKAA